LGRGEKYVCLARAMLKGWSKVNAAIECQVDQTTDLYFQLLRELDLQPVRKLIQKTS
jgi:hypothetical protein